MAGNFLQGLFEGAPRTAFDAYSDTAKALNTIRSQKIANALNQIKLNYAPQMAQQAADTGAADTSIEQNKAKYAPLLSQLTVHQKQIENSMNDEKFKYLPTELQQGIALKAQQIEKIKQDIQLAPKKLQQQQSRFGSAYQLNKGLSSLDPASRAAWIASHPTQYSQMLDNLAAGADSSAAQNVPGTNQASTNISPSSPNIVAPQNNNSSPMASPAGNDVTNSNPTTSPFQFTSQIAANKKSVSAPIYKRFENGLEFEKFLSDKHYDRIAKNAALYAGALGKGKAAIDSLRRSNPQSYEDYLEFHNSFASTAANYNKVMEGLGVQASQREEILGNITKAFDSNTGNPERALDQYNRWKDNMHRVVKSASLIAQPAYPGLLEKKYGINLDEPSSVSLSDVNDGKISVISPAGKPGKMDISEFQEAVKHGWKKR